MNGNLGYNLMNFSIKSNNTVASVRIVETKNWNVIKRFYSEGHYYYLYHRCKSEGKCKNTVSRYRSIGNFIDCKYCKKEIPKSIIIKLKLDEVL